MSGRTECDPIATQFLSHSEVDFLTRGNSPHFPVAICGLLNKTKIIFLKLFHEVRHAGVWPQDDREYANRSMHPCRLSMPSHPHPLLARVQSGISFCAVWRKTVRTSLGHCDNGWSSGLRSRLRLKVMPVGLKNGSALHSTFGVKFSPPRLR